MSKKIILVIDNDVVVLEGIKTHFEQQDYDVINMENTHGLLEGSKDLDLFAVILDASLSREGSEESGIDILKKIISVCPHLPVIMVTGPHDEQVARQAIELGALDYVTKPIDFEYLQRILTMQSLNITN